MKFSLVLFTAFASNGVAGFSSTTPRRATFVVSTTTELNANIRGPTEKSSDLRFGWDGTTALGGAVENAAPSRMLEDIRAAGESK